MVHAAASGSHSFLFTQALDRFLIVSDDHFAYWQRIWHLSGQRLVRSFIKPLQQVSLSGINYNVAQLYRRSFDVNIRDSKDHSPLSYACENGRYDVVCQLIDNGASSSITSALGVAPIFMHACSNSPVLVKRLFQAGADPLLEIPNPNHGNDKRE